MIRELRHSANKLRRVESNFGDLAAVGELFGSLPKLPHPIFFAQGKKYVGTLSLRVHQYKSDTVFAVSLLYWCTLRDSNPGPTD